MTGILSLLLASKGASSGTSLVIQSFTASGSWTCPTGVTEVEYLVVAGGGSGGDNTSPGTGNGGGGAGGFRTGTGLSVTAGTT